MMEALNNAILGIWFPIAYIAASFLYKRVHAGRLLVGLLFVLLMLLNWSWVGRIQNVHAIGLAVLAVYLFPPRIETKKYFFLTGVALLIMLLINRGADYDSAARSSVLFGPNTDALLAILMLSPVLYSKIRYRFLIYLALTALVVFSTQSRSALIIIFPIFLLAIPALRRAMFCFVSYKRALAYSYFLYLSVLLFVYAVYQSIEIVYLSSIIDPEARWNLASQASDMDRMMAFLAAKEASFADWSSVLLGSDILPAVTNADNVVHSELFSVIFGGGVFIFIFVSLLLIHNVFRVKSYFSLVYISCYLVAAGFSTSMLSFPCLYMISALLCSRGLYWNGSRYA